MTFTSTSSIKMTESKFNYFTSLEVLGGYLAEKRVEKCYPVIHHGMVQYLSHKERVNIISGNGADFDIVPDEYDGPEYKEAVDYHFIDHRSDEFCIATEWDGTKQPVYVQIVPNTGYLSCDMFVLYQDGLCHQMRQADFRVLVGKQINPLLHGRPLDTVAMVSKALAKAASTASGEEYDDGEEIPF